ncbi:MAG: response regulator, partial [Pseudomonadota bacterium]
ASDNRFLVLGKSAEGRRAAVDALRVLRADVEIVEASSQKAAARDWSGALPAVAVVAFDLEGQNGLEAARKIRALSPDTKIVVYSATVGPAMPEAARRELSELNCGVAEGPLTADTILNALDACAAQRAALRAACAAHAFT